MVADDHSGRSTKDVDRSGRLLTAEYPEDLPGGVNWLERINPQSLETVDPCYERQARLDAGLLGLLDDRYPGI